MNYYYPYYFMNSATSGNGVRSLLGSFGRGLSLRTILDGTQRTLGVVNQVIPIIKEAAPVVKNARTMFRVMNEFKKIESPSEEKNASSEEIVNNSIQTDGGPTFFA